MRRLPELLRHDAQRGRLSADPGTFRPRALMLSAPPVALLRPVVHELAAVERPIENLVHRGRRPPARPSLLRPWRRRGLLVETFGDRRFATPLRAELENPAHDGGLGLVDAPFHVRALAVRAR